MSDQIKVAIKVRPLIEREQFENQAWSVLDNTIFQIDPSTGKRRGDIYKFDHIFDTFSRNEDVFDTIVKPLVEAAVGGFNATIFAYGQTSSGKTYTMSGDETECGVIQMAISHMFETMKQTSGREFLARASHLEIYNEKVRDLLGSDKTNLKIREAEGNAVVVSNLKEEIVADVSKTIDLMKKGERKRHVGETAMNEKSSRSHSIFRIIIESRDTGEGDAGAIQVSQLNFVDLAGSERVNQTGAQGERLKEGCSINRSLFMLGHVISQLSEGQRAHINFRDSKLTRILQPSLGGNALTVIICTVTPAAIEETHCTLGFASRAKKIKNEPHVNEVLSDGTLLKRYARQLSKLKAELEEAKASNYAQEVEAMENKLEEKDKHNRLLQARIDLLTEKLISGVTTKDRKQAFKRRRTWCAPSARLSFLPFSLARIDEVASPCQEPVNILESSLTSQFQIPLEEFEIQLLSAEADSVSSEPPIIADVMQSPVSEFTDNSVAPVLSCPHVTSRSRRKRYSVLPIDLDSSPAERICHAGCQTDPIAISPEHTCNSRSANGTPRNELRERISFWKSEHDLMTMEYDELREYTRLEADVIRDLYEQLEKSKQEVIKTQEENVKAKMRIHELEEQNRQSNRKWETLDMEFLSDVPTTPEGKERRQLQEENIPYNEIIAEKETANQLLEEQLRHMSVVMAEINDTKNSIVSQKDKEILALQEEMSLLKTDQEAHKQELVRLQELVAQSSSIIEDKDKMILHLEDKLSCFLSDSGDEEIINNELKRLNTSLLEKNQEILALQDQILLLNTNFGNEKIMLQDEIAEREQRICNLEEQLTSVTSNTATREIGDDLKTKIADLESMVFEKNKLIADLEEQVSLLNTKATGERCEISKVQEDIIQCTLAEKEQKIIELEEKLLHSSSSIATAAETMNKLENEISNLKNIISEKTEELAGLQEKISLPNISVCDEKLQVSTLSEEIAHLSLMIKEKDQRIIDLEERLLHASSVTTAAETLTEMENEIANLKNVISDNNREILTLQNQISQDTVTERLKEEISVLQGEISKYCITVREKDQKIFDLEEQVLHMSSVSSSTATELENEVIGLKEIISEKNKELITYQDRLSLSVNAKDHKQELDRLLDEKTEQSVVIADEEQKILSLERQLLQAPSFIMTADTECELENEVTNAILDSKEIANHSVLNEEEQKIVQLEQLSCTSSVPFCSEAMNELQNKIAYLENIISRKNEENLILLEKISNTGEKRQDSGLLELGMSSITSTAETVTKLEKEITTLRNVISEKNCEIVALQDQIPLVTNTDGEKQEVPALQKEIAQQRLIIQEKDSRLCDLEDQLLTISSVTPSAETAIELKNKVANLMDVISEKNEIILALQDQIESLSSNIDGQRKEMVRLHEEAAQHSETIKEKEQNICDMREQLSCLSSPITTMKSVNELENKITRLRNIISDKEHEILALQNYKSLVSTAEGQEEEAIVLHQEKDQNYILKEREPRNVKKEPLLCHESSDSPYGILTELEKEVAHLKNIISEKNGEILVFRDQVSSLRNSAEYQKLEVNRLKEEIALQSVIVKDKDQRIIDLEEQVSHMSSILSATDPVPKLETEMVNGSTNRDIFVLEDQVSLSTNAEDEVHEIEMSQKETSLHSDITYEKDQRIIELEKQLLQISSGIPSDVVHNDTFNKHQTEIAKLNYAILQKDEEILSLKEKLSCEADITCKMEGSSMSEEKTLFSICKEADHTFEKAGEQLSKIDLTAAFNNHDTETEIPFVTTLLSDRDNIKAVAHRSLNISESEEISMPEEEFSQRSVLKKGKEESILDLEAELKNAPTPTTDNHYIHNLETEISNMKAVIIKKNEEILVLQDQMCALNTNAVSDQEDLSRLKEEFVQLSAIAEEKDSIILDLKEQLSNSCGKEELCSLKEEVTELSALAEEKEHIIVGLKEQLSLSCGKEDLCRLKEEVVHWPSIAQEKNNIIVGLKEQPSASCGKEDLCRLKEEVAQLSARTVEKDNIILDLEAQLSVSCSKEELCRLREEVTQWCALAEEKEHIIAGLKEQLSVSCGKEEVCRLKEEVAKLAALTVEKDEIILDLKEQLSLSCGKEDLCRIKEEVAECSSVAEDKEPVIEGLKEQLSLFCAKEDLCRLKEEVAHWSSVAEEKEHIIEGLKEQLSVLCNKEDLCRLKEEVAHWCSIAQEKDNIIEGLKEQLSLLCGKEDLCRLKEEVTQWCALAEEKEYIIVSLKEELSLSCGKEDLCRLKEEVAQLSALTEEKEHIIVSLKEQLSLSCDQEDLCRLKEEVVHWSSTAQEKEHMIEGLKEQLSLSCNKEDLCRLKEEVAQLSALTEEKEHIIVSLKEQLSLSCDQEDLCRLKEEVVHWSSIAHEKEHIIEGLKEQLSLSCNKEDLCRLKEEVAQLSALAEEKEHIIVGLKEQLSLSCGKEDLCRLKEEVVHWSSISQEKDNIIVGLKEQLSASCGKEDLCRLKEEVAQLSARTVEKDNIILDLEAQLSVSCSKEELCRLREEVTQWCALAEEKEHIIAGLKEQLSVSCGKEEFCRLKEEVAKLSALTVGKDEIILDLKEQLSLSCGKEDLCRIKEEVAECSSVAEDKEHCIEGLKEQLSLFCAKEDLSRLKEEVALWSSVAEEKEHIIEGLKEQLSVSCNKEDLCRLKEEFVQLSAIAEEKDNIILDLKEQLSNSCGKEELCSLKEEVNKLSALAEEKEHIIVSLKEQLSLSCGKEDLGRLKEEVAHWSSIAEEKEHIIVGFKEQLSLSCDKEDLCRLKEEVTQWCALAEEKEHIIVDLKEQLSVSCGKEEFCRLKEEVAKLSVLAEEKEHIIVGLKEQLSALTEGKDKIIHDLKEQLSLSCGKEDLCRLKEEIAQWSSVAEEKEHIIEELKEQLSHSCGKEDLCRLKEEVAQLSALTLEKDNIILDLKEQLSLSCAKEDLCRLKEEVAQWYSIAEGKEHIIVGLREQLSVTCDKEELCRLKEEVMQLSALTEEKDNIIKDLKEQLPVSCDKEELTRLKEEVVQWSTLAKEKECIIVGLKEQLSCESDKELEARLISLNSAISQKDTEIVSLKEEILSISTDMSCKMQETVRLQEEIAQWCTVVKEKNETIKGLEEQLSLVLVSSETVNNLEAEIDSLKNVLSERNYEVQAFEEHERSLTVDLTSRNEVISRLEEELAQLSTVIRGKEQKIFDLELELRNSSTTDNKFVHDLEHEILNLKTIISEKDKESIALQEQISMLHTNSTSEKQELGRLKEVVQSITEEKDCIIIGLKEQLSVSCETVKELESGIANLMNAVSQKDTEILALKEKISTFDIDIANEKQKANRLLEEIAQWSATVSEKEKLVQNLEEKLLELSSLEAEIVNLKNIVSNKQNENMALKEQIGMLNANAVTEKQELSSLREVVAQSSAVLEERENLIVDLERQLSAYSESMKELEARNANLNVDISLKDMEILSLKEELSSLDAAVSSEKQGTLRLQKDIAQWCGVGKEKDQTIEVSKEQVSFPSTLINNDCVNNNEVEINNRTTNLSDKNNEIAVLNELVTSLRTDLDNRIQEINKLEEEITRKSAVTKEKEQKILELEEQLKCMLGEITNEVRVLDELISVEAGAAADNQKHKGLKEEKQFTSKSSLSIQGNLELSQGQIYENNRAVHLLEEELSNLSKKLGEESETVKKLQHENKTMKNKLIEMVEHRKHLVSEILALDSKFERDSLEEYQLSELLKTFCSCIMQKEEEVLGFQIQQHELLVEEKNRLTSRLECLESEILEKENEYKNLLCAYDDVRVAKDILTAEVEKKTSHLDSVKNDLVGATKEIEQLNCKLSSLKAFEVIFDKLLKNLSAVPELNVHSGHDVLQAVNMLIDNIQNPQTIKDLKWKDCLKEIFEGDNEVKKLFESVLKNKQNLESEKDYVGYAVESRASSYSFCGDSLANCHLTNSVQKTNVDIAKVFEIASEIDGESNLAIVIRSFIQRLISAKEYDNKNSILTEQLDCMKQQNELLKKHLDSLLGIGETKKEVKAMENVINEIPELVSSKPVLKVVHELQSEELVNNTEWEKDGAERIAIKMTLLKKLEDDMNKIRELLASVTELDRPIEIVSSVDMLIKNLQRSWEITEEVSSLRAENDSLRKEMTVLKSDIGEIEFMFHSVQDEVNSDLAVKRACFMKDRQHLKDIINAKLQIVKEMEKVERDISELLSSVPELDLGNGTVNAVKVLVENFISSKHLTERMNKLEEERRFSKQESIALQKRLECLTLDLQGKGEECDYLQNVLSSQQAKVEKLEGEISHYSEYVEKLEIDARKIFELSALEPGLGHQNNTVTAFTIVLEKLHTAQKLNEDKFKLEIEFAKVRKENEDMKKEIVELKHNVQAKKEELFKAQREIENKQITENEVHCIQILKEELEALKRDLHDFEKESLNDYEMLLMSDQNSAEDLVLAVRFLFQKFKAVKNCTIENVKLNKILNELKQENTIIKENLESLTSEIETVKENNNDLMKALNNVQAAKEKLLLEMEETVNSKQFEIKALKDSLNCKSAILHTMEDNNAKINTLLSSYPEFYCNTDTISSISAMIKRLQFCRENHETKLKDENLFLRQENEAMQKQIVVLKSDIESQKQTCKHLSETVRKLQTNINEISSKEIKESSNWESFKEEIITKAQSLEMTMEPDLIGIYEQIINIPEIDFPRNLIPLVTLLTDKLAKQDLKNRVLNNKLYFETSKHEETLKEIRSYETEIYQMEEKIENLSIAVKQEREQAENLRSEKVRLEEEVAALKVAKKQLDEVSTASEKLQTAEKWLAEREEVIANLRLAEKQFSDLGYKRQGDIITRVGSKCSPYQIGSSAKLRIKKLEEQVNELRRQLLEQQEGASGRSMVSIGVNTVKGNECGNCLASQMEIRNLKFEILGHKSKVELLKDQIEREEMKYKEDAEVFERKLGAAKSKIGELKMEIRRLQTAQEVSFVAGARKKQPAINMCDQQIQTDKEADVMYRMSGEGSGIVNDYIVTVYKEKVNKLQHDNELLKELSRRRLHKIRLLQGQLPPEDKEEMEKIESRKENIDCNVNSGKTSDSTHKRKKPASSSHS